MSRYVDLDGVSWDGKLIASKLQEVQTEHGYMLGITSGWLWDDDVPHIDLEEHDKQVRSDAIDDFKDNLIKLIQLREESHFYDISEHDYKWLIADIMYSAEKLKE